VVSFEYEGIVLDNESEDNSVEIAQKYGASVYSIQRDAFTFGSALNYGFSLCKGEILMAMSAHVVLLNEYFLEQIPAYFSDDDIAGLRFVMIPSQGSTMPFLSKGPVKLTYSEEKDFATKEWGHFIVNHCSAIRRKCWEAQKFDETIFSSEDKLWSLRILMKGYTIIYNIPCYYIYVKELERSYKIRKRINSATAFELITGDEHKDFKGSYISSFKRNFLLLLRRMRNHIIVHNKVYKGKKKFKAGLNQNQWKA